MFLQKRSDITERRSRSENTRHTQFEKPSRVIFRHDAADDNSHIAQPACTEQVENARYQRHVRSAEQAQPKPIGIFIGHRADDGFRRLPQTRVNHMETRIAQTPRDDLNAPVVAIQSDFREHDSLWNLRHGNYILGHHT